VKPLRRARIGPPVPPARELERRFPQQLPAADSPSPLPRRTRRRSRYAIGAAVVVIIGVAAFALLAGGTGKQRTSAAVSTHYATVARTDLVATTPFDGVVASQAGPAVVNRTNGTITAMRSEGKTISRGQTLYSVNGQPVILMYGSTPAWRDIGGPRITDGVDVQQLEANLQALGYNPGTVDQTFTADTASAITAWQTAAGLVADGVAHLGQVFFASGAVEVNNTQTTVGTPVRDGQQVMTTLLESTKVVNVSFDASSQSTLSGGQSVAIVAADGTSYPASVTSVTAPSSGQGGGGGNNASSTAVVTPQNASALAKLKDGAAVTVNLVTDTRRNVLAVPVTALLARTSGGYAVQVVRGNGTVLVAVTPGLYANDLVEVTGDLQQGDKVVVP